MMKMPAAIEHHHTEHHRKNTSWSDLTRLHFDKKNIETFFIFDKKVSKTTIAQTVCARRLEDSEII